MSERLVTMTEIAELAGVRRPTVSNWRRRHEDFPDPARDDGVQPLFDAAEIAAWLDRRPVPDSDVTYGEQFRDGLRLQALASLRGTLSGDQVLRAGLALAALRQHTGRALPTSPAAAVTLARTVRHDLNIDLDELPGEAGSLVTAVEELCRSGGPKGAAERLLEQADRLGAGLRAEMTPDPVARLIAVLAGDVTGKVVHDPAAGSGSLLMKVIEGASPARVVAAERDRDIARLLGHRLTCHNLTIEIDIRDSLADPPGLDADVVVVDPPFASSDDYEVTRRDRSVSPWSWATYAAGHLTESGHALVLLPTWSLRRKGGQDDPVTAERTRLIRSGLVSAVIQLPRRSHSFRTGTELALVVLARRPRRPGEVLFCDSDQLAQTGDDEAWRSAFLRLLNEGEIDRPDAARWVPLEDIPDGDPVVPARWLRTEEEPRSYVEELIAEERRLTRLPASEEESERIPVVEARPRLGRVGARDVVQVLAGHRIGTGHIKDGSGGLPVIGADELAQKREIGSRRIDLLDLSDYEAAKPTEPGDVVILPTGQIRTWVDEQGGNVVLSPAQALRIRGYREYLLGRRKGDKVQPPGMTPRVLAALLMAPKNRSQVAGALVRRIDLARIDFPRLSPAEAVRLDALLADLERRRDAAAERLAALDGVLGSLVAGISDGALRVKQDDQTSGGMSGEKEQRGG